MKIKREDSARTRERLIDAASEVFAEKNYASATIAEICERAGANIALVNYHFGDKETLYREAWRHAHRVSLEDHPADGGVNDEAPPEERLRGSIKGLLLRITDKRDKEFLIIHREISSPTGLLEEVMETELLPSHRRVEAIVHDLLGSASSPERVHFCTISILNQCLHPIIKRIGDEGATRTFGSKMDIEAFIDHVAKFSLGGIRAIAEIAQSPLRAGKAKKKSQGKE